MRNANYFGMRQTAMLASSIALFCTLIARPATAAVITVGNYPLLANTPNQTILITITGGEAVAGEDFFAQLGDGGTFNSGTNTKPVFSNVNILTGTIFSTSNTGATGDPNGTPAGSNTGHPLIWVDGTSTSTGTVSATGLFATLTVSTVGLSSGTYPLLLKGVANAFGTFNTALRDGNGANVPLTITNGSVTVAVPEPTSLAFIACGAVLVLRRRIRRAE